MALTASEVRQESTGLDRDFVLAVLLIENQVEDLTQAAAEDMAAAVMRQATATGIKDQDSLVIALIELLAAYFVLLDQTILDGQVRIAKLKASEGQTYLTALNQAEAFGAASQLRQELREFPDFVAKTFAFRRSGTDNLTYQGRIKSIQLGAEQTVRNIVANGMTKGESAAQIAQKIQRYVSPAAEGARTRPFAEWRERFGRASNLQPKTIRPGSVRTNAMMIARTETAEMYRDATERLYGKKRWVKGYRWVLSNSHPQTDVCDSLASHGLYEKDSSRPFSHPHCVCEWLAERYSDSELSRMVKRGELE